MPVSIDAALPAELTGKVNLCYRRVNQAEKWVTVAMEPAWRRDFIAAVIPASYIASPYPLQYYFEVQLDSGEATFFPGLARDYSTQPYYLIRRG